jgi:hypothetical protein
LTRGAAPTNRRRARRRGARSQPTTRPRRLRLGAGRFGVGLDEPRALVDDLAPRRRLVPPQHESASVDLDAPAGSSRTPITLFSRAHARARARPRRSQVPSPLAGLIEVGPGRVARPSPLGVPTVVEPGRARAGSFPVAPVPGNRCCTGVVLRRVWRRGVDHSVPFGRLLLTRRFCSATRTVALQTLRCDALLGPSLYKTFTTSTGAFVDSRLA